MTNSQLHSKPSKKQLSWLEDLAEQVGESFTYPQTGAQASAEIKRMLGRKRSSAADRRRERAQVSRDMAMRHGDDAAVRSSELRGYGSHAAWG